MYKILIKELILYGNHGVYAEEQLLQSPYQIDIICTLKESSIVKELEDSVDYEKVFQLIKPIFATTYLLLEVLATDMGNAIKAMYNIVDNVTISIQKLNPPIVGFQGKVGVEVVI